MACAIFMQEKGEVGFKDSLEKKAAGAVKLINKPNTSLNYLQSNVVKTIGGKEQTVKVNNSIALAYYRLEKPNTHSKGHQNLPVDCKLDVE